MNLGNNFISEGLANRVTPFTTNVPGAKNFDTEKVYTNMMTRYRYGGLDKKGLYLDETVLRMCYTHRRLFAQLALQLISEGKIKKAKAVLEKADKVIPAYNVPLNFLSGAVDLARAYALVGNKKKALEYISAAWKDAEQFARWYLALSQSNFNASQSSCLTQFYILNQIIGTTEMVDKSLARKKAIELDMLTHLYQKRGGTMPQ